MNARAPARIHRRFRTAALPALLACLMACGPSPAAEAGKNEAAPTGEISGVVVHVTDGDTMHVAGQRRAVRLWGIDTPERGQPGFFAAAAWLESHALGREVRCVVKQQADRYGRPVGQCFVEGRDLGAGLVAAGAARDMPRFSGGFYARP